MSPKGELASPYVLLEITDAAPNRESDSGLIRAFNAKSLKPESHGERKSASTRS